MSFPQWSRPSRWRPLSSVSRAARPPEPARPRRRPSGRATRTAGTSSRSSTIRSPATTATTPDIPATRPKPGKKVDGNSSAVQKWQGRLVQIARLGTGQGRRRQDLRLHGHQQRCRRQPHRQAGDRPRGDARRDRRDEGPSWPSPRPRTRPSTSASRARRPVVAARRRSQRRRGPGRRRPRHGHLAREHRVRGRHRHPRARRLARQVRGRRAVPGQVVQRQARRRPLLRRRASASTTSPRPTTCRRATVTATARTRRPPRPATTARPSPSTATSSTTAAARAWRPAPRSPCTRCAGRASRASNPGCFNSDSVAAINDAVLDGVDVINYSIGGVVRVQRARLGRAGVPGRVQRRRLRRRLGRQQRPRREHVRPPGAVDDHRGRGHVPPCVPGGRARQRRPVRRRVDHGRPCRRRRRWSRR